MDWTGEADWQSSPCASDVFGESGEKWAAVVIGCGRAQDWRGALIGIRTGRLTGVQLQLLLSSVGAERAQIGGNNTQDSVGRVAAAFEKVRGTQGATSETAGAFSTIAGVLAGTKPANTCLMSLYEWGWSRGGLGLQGTFLG